MSKFIIALLASAAMLSACGSDAPEQSVPQTAEQQERIRAVPVARGEVKRVINASGKVQPKETVLIGSEVSGRLLEVNVDFNSEVKVGDILAKIDGETFRNRVQQLEASLNSAEADIRIREASINRAEVNLAQAKIVLNRRQGLYDERATSLAQLEEAQRTVGVSEADLRLANAQLDAATAQKAQTMASLRTARIDLGRTTIKSPIDGIVIERKVDPGQTVQASFSAPELFRIAADLSEIQVEASIVESDVAGLDNGDAVQFTVDAYPNTPITGQVVQLRLNPTNANNIVTYTAIISAKNDSGRLLPGMTANLELTTDSKPNVLRIPANAERFRPTPAQVEKYVESRADDGAEKSLNAPTYARLEMIGLSGSELSTLKTELEEITKPMRETINDPTRTWAHSRAQRRMSETTDFFIQKALTPDQLAEYTKLVTAELSTRAAKLYVRTGDGKIAARDVKLGLSDGAFIEVISGVAEGDRVVTAISAGGGGRQGGRGRGRPGGRPGGTR